MTASCAATAAAETLPDAPAWSTWKATGMVTLKAEGTRAAAVRMAASSMRTRSAGGSSTPQRRGGRRSAAEGAARGVLGSTWPRSAARTSARAPPSAAASAQQHSATRRRCMPQRRSGARRGAAACGVVHRSRRSHCAVERRLVRPFAAIPAALGHASMMPHYAAARCYSRVRIRYAADARLRCSRAPPDVAAPAGASIRQGRLGCFVVRVRRSESFGGRTWDSMGSFCRPVGRLAERCWHRGLTFLPFQRAPPPGLPLRTAARRLHGSRCDLRCPARLRLRAGVRLRTSALRLQRCSSRARLAGRVRRTRRRARLRRRGGHLEPHLGRAHLRRGAQHHRRCAHHRCGARHHPDAGARTRHCASARASLTLRQRLPLRQNTYTTSSWMQSLGGSPPCSQVDTLCVSDDSCCQGLFCDKRRADRCCLSDAASVTDACVSPAACRPTATVASGGASGRARLRRRLRRGCPACRPARRPRAR